MVTNPAGLENFATTDSPVASVETTVQVDHKEIDALHQENLENVTTKEELKKEDDLNNVPTSTDSPVVVTESTVHVDHKENDALHQELKEEKLETVTTKEYEKVEKEDGDDSSNVPTSIDTGSEVS